MANIYPLLKVSGSGGTGFNLGLLPGKGVGCFADQAIPKGSAIMAERPWFVINKPLEQIREEDVTRCCDKLDDEKKQMLSILRSNVVFDPNLKKCAEQRDLPIAFSGTLAYIKVLLLKAEGIRTGELIEAYIIAAMAQAIRYNPKNKVEGVRPSASGMLLAQGWMRKAGEIVNYMRTSAQDDLYNFKKTEELFYSGNATATKWYELR
ncbi:MAG: hypothetical protein M1821_004963 [Bathelium mastoideum]|nr:MAG: hypothetical protein M1821_004963 [Bathelium mastoideum]KAI9688994.1 MAG: hypothetical protein M1822_000731 [Bathelium mastoideum]